MEEFARSDIAAECGAAEQGEGICVQRAAVGACDILRVHIKNEETAKRVGKPQGRYVSVECGEIAALDTHSSEQVRCVLSVELREMAQRMCGRRIGSDFSLLVVGLGNAQISSDALGAKAVESLAVTGHLGEVRHRLFDGCEVCRIAAIPTGVPGQTGVQTAELVRGAVLATSPDLVVAVDALTARSPQRLGRTVQLSDTGILPGSGLGAGTVAITKESIGVPVLSLGVPTVVNSATLAADALCLAGYASLEDEVRNALRQVKNMFVTPKDVDVLVSSSALLVAQALEKAFSLPLE